MSRKNAEILLASLILARSASFLFNKILLGTMSPFTLMGIRFLIAGAILIVIFRKKLKGITRATFFKGVLMGFCFFILMASELFGLQTVASSSAALLENTSIVFVPIFESIIRKSKPSKITLLSTGITFVGVILLNITGSGFNFGIGEFFCLTAAVIYAGCLILTDRLSKKDDPLVLGTLQVTFMGVFGMIAAFIFETPALPQSCAEWGAILFLAVVCSSFGFALQPAAQKYTTSENTAVLCALNPMGAAILGMVFLHERLGAYGLIGAALVLAGIIIQNHKQPV